MADIFDKLVKGETTAVAEPSEDIRVDVFDGLAAEAPKPDAPLVKPAEIRAAPEDPVSLYERTMSFFEDPGEEEARNTIAIYRSELYGIPPSTALRYHDAMNDGIHINPKAAQLESDGIDRLKQSWDKGVGVVNLGKLGWRQMLGDVSEETALLVDEEKKKVPTIEEEFISESFVEDGLRAAAELTPFMVEASAAGLERGGVLGLGALAIERLALQSKNPVAVSLAAGMFAVGVTSGALETTMQVEGGNAYIDMIDKGIEPETARWTALGYGTFAGALEVTGLKILLKSLPGGGRILKRQLSNAMQEEARKMSSQGTALNIANNFTEQFGSVLSAETGIELAQTAADIFSQNVAINLNNRLEGTNIPQSTIDEVMGEFVQTFETAVKGFGVIALPGPALTAVAPAIRPITKPVEIAPEQVDIAEGVEEAASAEEAVKAGEEPKLEEQASDTADAVFDEVKFPDREATSRENAIPHVQISQADYDTLILSELSDEQVVDELIRPTEGIEQAPEATPTAPERAVEAEIPAGEGDVPQKLANAIGKPNEPEVLERSGVVDDEAQIHEIVRDEIQSKLDFADAFEARGDLGEATRLREEARESGETLKEADGITTERAVDSVLGGEEVGVALTELERSQQEARAAELTARAEEIEAGVPGTARVETVLPTERKAVKARIREVTGQRKVEGKLVGERAAFREVMKKSVQAARKAFREGRLEGVEVERARINEIKDNEKTKIRTRKQIARIKKRAKKFKKSKKSDIAVDYQKKIKELLATVDLKGKPTAKTQKNLEGLRDWLKRHEDNLQIPPERIDQLTRLSKTPLADFTVEELAEFEDTLKTLTELGRLKRQLQVKYNKKERAKQIDRLIQSTNNVDPKKFDPDKPTKLQIFDRGLRTFYMETQLSSRVTDMMDGFGDFNGPNTELIKDFLQGETVSKVNTQAIVVDTIEQIVKETGIAELTEEQQVNMMINIRFREGAFDQVKTLMVDNGLTEIPELSKEEERFIKIIQGATNQFTDELAATVEEIDNTIFVRLPTYILPLKYESEFNIAPSETINHTRHRTARVTQGFKFERVKGVQRKPRTDILAIFEEAINDQQWYLEMQPRLERARQLVLAEEYQEAAGGLNSNWWKTQLDQIARRGWSATATSNPVLRTVRINMNQAILGYKLSSIVMQPFAIFDAMAYSTSRWGVTTTSDLIRSFTKAWVNPAYAESILKKSPALQVRRAGEIAVEEVLEKVKKGKSLREKYIKGGLKLLQKADLVTAAGVREALKDILINNEGLEASQAEVEADFLMNMVSGSAEVSLRPQVLGRGEGARTWFTFQSFFLNRWGIISNDIIASKLLKGDWKAKYTASLALAIFIGAGITEDEFREFLFEAVSGRELPDQSIIEQALLFLPSNVPIAGNFLQAAIRGGSALPPAPRVFEAGVKGVTAVATGKKPETRLRGALRTAEAFLALILGIPGTAQTFDVAERVLLPEKRRKR